MNTAATLATCAAVGVASMAGIQAVTHGDINWTDLIGGGSTGMVIFVVVLFLRTMSEMRKEHGDVVTKICADFSESMKAATAKYAEETNAILQQILSEKR